MPRLVQAVCACALLLFAAVAGASQVIHLDTRGLTRESSDIVIGRVGDQHAHWNSAHTMIVTDVTIVVDQSLKGGPGTSLTLTQVGGEVDGMRYSVEGSPRFTSGEEVLVFAWRDALGRPQVDGLAQGKFEIRRDAATGARTVQRSPAGLEVGDARSLRVQPAGGGVTRVPLDDLVREIRAAMAEAGR
ncbi:MAG: hypothetical protein ACRENS_00210 [Candidatus Eiseniibacteriota bacterium]